jgi:hypothetical protein
MSIKGEKPSSINEVLPDAFLLGTGISREKSLASERYSELVQTFPKVPYLQPEQAVEMALLGEMIADRAFRTLPVQLRNFATVWQKEDYQGQLDILRLVYDTLGPKSFARRSLHEDNHESQSLPHQYGSWSKRRYQPSCLGVAQMLVGFARAAKAEHMLIDILQPRGIYWQEVQYRGLNNAKRLIKESGDPTLFKALEKELDEALIDVLETLDRNYEKHQAHHALAIRVSGEWWIIDPYFETLRPLKRGAEWGDQHHDNFQAHPRMALIELKSDYECDIELSAREAGLNSIIPYLSRLHEPMANWQYTASAMRCAVESFIFHDIDKESDVSTADKAAEVVFTHMLSPVAVERFTNQPKDQRADGDVDAFFAQQKKQADTVKRYRNTCMKRLTHHLMASYCTRLLNDEGENQQAHVQEFSHGTFQLAVRTVNQLGYMRSIDTPNLVLYSRSQWILRDSLEALRRTPSKRLRRIAQQRINYTSRYPEFLMPDFRLHLKDKVGKQ